MSDVRLSHEETEWRGQTLNLADHFRRIQEGSLVYPHCSIRKHGIGDRNEARARETQKLLNPDLAALRAEIRDRNTSPERLLEIASMGSMLSRAVATHKYIPSEVLKVLSNNDDWVTRARVARNRKTNLETLQKLASDKESAVIRNLLLNVSVTEDVVRGVLKHEDADLRWRAFHACLFRGYFTESEIVSEMDSRSPEIRRSIAAFWKDLPLSQALRYLRDSDKWVRHTVLSRQMITRPLNSRHGGRPYRLKQLLSIEEISALLNDEEPEIRQLAAQIVNHMTQLQGETP